MNITYSELFQLCMVIIGVISLVLQAKKEVTAVPFHSPAITSKH